MSTTYTDERDGYVRVGVVTVAAVAGVMLAASAAAVPGLASESAAEGTTSDAMSEALAHVAPAPTALRQADKVLGTFSFTQSRTCSAEEVSGALGGVRKTLCSQGDGQVSSHGDVSQAQDVRAWSVSFTGDGLSSDMEATVGELAKVSSASTLMGCTCLGNPADGRATVNADVCGIDLRAVMYALGIEDGANTVTFTCADGYEVSLPLSYVLQRRALLVYELDGRPLSESVGGTNQVWLGSTAARYFAGDVVSIRVECLDEADVPPAPGTEAAGDRYENRPNVGVLEGLTGIA